MSEYAKKTLGGKATSAEDWVSHLVAAHTASPSMTPRAFAGVRADDGRNSYEVLAAALDPIRGRDATVLDLACGDGHLARYLLPRLGPGAHWIGIDMVASEIATAQREIRDPRARFHVGTAQSLPVPDASVDAVLCHLALMLMLPVEPVASEVGRALKKGGCFAGIVGGKPRAGTLAAEIASAITGLLSSRYPACTTLLMGDARAKTPEGLREILGAAAGFAGKVTTRDFEVSFSGDPESLWRFNEDMYIVGLLPPAAKAELRREILGIVERRRGADGLTRLDFPLRYFHVVR